MESDYQQQPMDDLDHHGQPHQPHFGQQHKKSKKKLFIVIGIIAGAVLVLGAGAVAAYLLMHKSGTTAPPKQQASASPTTAQSQPQVPSGVQTEGTNYIYKSTTLKIGVTYPKTWTMRESTDKQEIILTSPSANYVKKDGTNTQGVFTVKLRNGIIPDGIKATVAAATAVADSQVIAYAKPTTDQRQYTNLSYVGPNANDFTFGIITGYTAYKAGQAVGGGIDLNGQAYLFAGGYGTDAADTLTFESVPKTSYDTAVFKQAGAIFESLQLY